MVKIEKYFGGGAKILKKILQKKFIHIEILGKRCRIEFFRKKYSESHFNSKVKVIVNAPEWEITLYLHEFDELWMRYTLGREPDKSIRKSHFFQDFTFNMRRNLLNSDKKEQKNCRSR